MADKGSVLLKDKDVDRHRGFEVQLFERTDGDWKIRLILSGYTFMRSGAQGFPDGHSDCKNYVPNPYTNPNEQCLTVPYTKAYVEDACGYTVYDPPGSKTWSEGLYTRVHRDRSIILAMRRWMGLPTQLTNEDLGLNASCQ